MRKVSKETNVSVFWALQSADTTQKRANPKSSERQKHLASKVKPINELIKQIQNKLIQVRVNRSSEPETRKPFRSQVIDGALEEKEDRRRAVAGLRRTDDKGCA